MPLKDYLSKTKQLQFRGGISIWNNALYIADGARFHGGIGIVVSQSLSVCLQQSGVIVEGGLSLQTQEDIEEYIQSYYVELYTNDPMVDSNDTARDQCLNSVSCIISNEMNEMLVREFSNEEILHTLKDIPNNKS
jgi:hypothetical protein